jgi:hypothetical protein
MQRAVTAALTIHPAIFNTDSGILSERRRMMLALACASAWFFDVEKAACLSTQASVFVHLGRLQAMRHQTALRLLLMRSSLRR